MVIEQKVLAHTFSTKLGFASQNDVWTMIAKVLKVYSVGTVRYLVALQELQEEKVTMMSDNHMYVVFSQYKYKSIS